MLTVDQLSCGRASTRLENISFSVAARTGARLREPAGTSSSLLLSAIAGHAAVGAGQITVAGHDITATARPHKPAAWVSSPTPAQAAASVNVTSDGLTSTVSLSPPTEPSAVTVIVTVGGTIRRTVTLPPNADRQLVIGIGSGRVCTVATWNQGTRMIATASACTGEPA